MSRIIIETLDKSEEELESKLKKNNTWEKKGRSERESGNAKSHTREFGANEENQSKTLLKQQSNQEKQIEVKKWN